MTFSVRSSSAALTVRISPSMRARAMAISPASLTSLSTRSARTRRLGRASAPPRARPASSWRTVAAGAPPTVAAAPLLGGGRGSIGIDIAEAAQLVDQHRAAVVGGFDLVEEGGRDVGRNLDARLQAVHDFADAHRAGHARAALQGMQQAPQLARRSRRRSGRSRQLRSSVPISRIRSCDSSRKKGSNCGSRSSCSRDWRRSSSSCFLERIFGGCQLAAGGCGAGAVDSAGSPGGAVAA